jgi:hypothetical protein
MINLQGQPGELRFTVQITRKDTGKVEEVELIGKLIPEELTNGSDPLDSSAQRCD